MDAKILSLFVWNKKTNSMWISICQELLFKKRHMVYNILNKAHERK